MENQDLEPLEDWMKRMEKLLNQGKPYTKEEHDNSAIVCVSQTIFYLQM